MKDDSVPTAPREARHSVIQNRFDNLQTTVDRLESLVGELAGKDAGNEKKSSNMEPFLPFWESLSERIDGLADRITKSTDEIRQMIL